MQQLDRIVDVLERILENARGSRDIHLEDRVGSEVFGLFGSATLNASSSATILTVANPRNFGMALHDLGIVATPALWGAANGITYSIRRNDSAFPHLGALDFPWGTIENRKRLKLAFRTGEALNIVATNVSTTDAIEVCVAVTGMFYSAVRGAGVSDKVR